MSDSIASSAILIVDDDPDVRALLIEALSPDGYDVDVACNGSLALDQLKERPYDLVISALPMRDFDTRAFYYEVAREYPALRRRFVFTSGMPPRSALGTFLRDVGAPVLSKPLDVDAIRTTVKELCGCARLAEPNDREPPGPRAPSGRSPSDERIRTRFDPRL